MYFYTSDCEPLVPFNNQIVVTDCERVSALLLVYVSDRERGRQDQNCHCVSGRQYVCINNDTTVSFHFLYTSNFSKSPFHPC